MTYFDIDALRHGFSSRDFLDESWSHGLGEVHLVIGDVELYLGVALGAHPAPVPGDGDVSSAGVPGGHRGIRPGVGLQCHLVPHVAGHAKAIPLGHEAPVRAWHVLLRQDGFSEVRGASVVGQDVGAGKRPDLRVAGKNVELAQKAVRLIESDLYPHVAANFDYLRRGDDYSVSGSRFQKEEEWQVTVGLNWKFFEWNKTANARKRAQKAALSLVSAFENQKKEVE